MCSAMAMGVASGQTGPYTQQAPVSGGSVSSTPAATSAREALGTPGDTRPSFWSASIALQETYTNNVNLNPSNAAESGWVTEITPFLGSNIWSARNSRWRRIAAGGDLCPSGVAENRVYPTVNLLGDLTLVDNFLFLEGAVNVAQQFFSPFGAQPASLVNPTANRYRTTVYRISPFIKGSTSNGTEYQLRNDNVWTNLSGAPINANSADYTNVYGNVANTETTLGWRASLYYSDVRFNTDQPATVTQLYPRYGNLYGHESLRLFGERGVGKQRVPVHEFAGCDLRRRLRLATLAGDD
jgi:uncharacterized protein (PEP-CTERM system associated)